MNTNLATTSSQHLQLAMMQVQRYRRNQISLAVTNAKAKIDVDKCVSNVEKIVEELERQDFEVEKLENLKLRANLNLALLRFCEGS